MSETGAASASRHGPLRGIRVLDLTSVVMGPYATQILGDLGADVISVEAPRGDTNRAMGGGSHPQLSGNALNLLRNKRNVALELSHPDARRAVLRIAGTCDVMVTNLRPAVLTRLGLTYAEVTMLRPDIVYCRAHGWASGSGRENDPAYDDVIQAGSGMIDLNQRATGDEHLVPMTVADKVCGLTIAYSVMAALVHRERHGVGQEIEVPMADVAAAFVLVEHGAGAIPQPAVAPAGYRRVLTPERRARPTKDGWICVLPYTREHYDAVFRVGGREDLVDDPRVQTGRGRIEYSDSLYRDVAAILTQRTTAEWLEVFAQLGVPCSPVASLDDLVDALPLVEHPIAGTYREIPPPVRFSTTPAGVRRRAPLIGQHGVEVLREVGYGTSEIEAMLASQILVVPGSERPSE